MPSPRDAAKKHIDSIRAETKLPEDGIIDGRNRNLAMIARLLALTSAELYSNIFHFIWEIIQNNDDADYENPFPELPLVLTDEAFYAWSNQTGFRKSDVESICNAGLSSKKNKEDTIGEKGIGFKSLFAVADRVTIHSEPYHFKFDTTTSLGSLGMVVPTWVDEPAGVTGKNYTIPALGTTVILHFKPDKKVNSLRHELENFDFSFLIFCRRLKKVSLLYSGALAGFSKEGQLYNQTSTMVTLRVQKSTTSKASEWKFRLFSNELTDMPSQLERPQQHKSTIRLAFTLPNDWSNGLMDEQTFAFMPMKRFGFNFMIHANFILTANRGEVIGSHQWNIKLRSSLGDLIVTAFQWFATSTDSPATYRWPHYAQSLFAVHDSFFKPLANGVIKSLKSTPLLSAEANERNFYQNPVQALFIPDAFRNLSDGQLILVTDELAKRSIKKEYKVSKQALEKLGVKEFSHQDFLCEFERMVTNETSIFRSQSLHWHGSVAVVLLNSRSCCQDFHSKCKGLDIVPLTSGEWVAPTTANLFLAGEDIQDIPSFLTISIVDPAACEDRSRRLLFETLGVKACNRERICEAIVAAHNNGKDDCLQDSVAQIKFLFLSKYRPKPRERLRLYCQAGNGPHKEVGIHIHLGKLGATIREQLGASADMLNWLGVRYECFPDNEQIETLASWLQTWTGFHLWPDVCRDHRLSPVMADLLKTKGSKVLLEHFMLRVKNGAGLPVKDEAWTRHVGQLECSTNQGLRKLCETTLPSLAALGEESIASLEIPEPGDPVWNFLGDFGVLTTVDARFLLQNLRSLRSCNPNAAIKNKVSKIYSQLGKFLDSQTLIRQAFDSEELILVDDGRWVKKSHCRWTANYASPSFQVLSRIYRSCQPLFKDILGIVATDLTDLLADFKICCSDLGSGNEVNIETAEALYQLLVEMNKFISKGVSASNKAFMKELCQFPILDAIPESGKMSIHMRGRLEKFWVADITWLQERFSGKVPLLLPLEGIFTTDLNNVFNMLDMDHKRLTKCVVTEISSDGPTGSPDEELTRFLKAKIPYMISLLQHAQGTTDSQDSHIAQLKRLQVQRVQDIKIRRYVQGGDERIYGRDEEGEICFKPGQGEMTIHIELDLQEPDVYGLLADHLGDYWRLEGNNRALLYKVITSTSPRRYIEAFERAGIPTPDSDNMSSQWLFSKLRSVTSKVRSSRAKSSLDGASQQPSLPELSVHVVEISDDENDTDVQAISLRPNTRANSSLNSAPQNLLATKKWTDKVVNATLVDETEVQHTQHVNKNYKKSRPSYRATSNDDTTMHDADTAQTTSNTLATNAYLGRTRATALTASEPTLLNALSERPSSSKSSAVQPSLSGGNPPAMRSPQQGYNDHNTQSSPSKKRKYGPQGYAGSQSEEVTHDIGRAGERLVYNFLSHVLGPSLTHHHWTSRNRTIFFPDEPFMGEEWDFSDFTYKDVDGKLIDYLAINVPGYTIPRGDSPVITYHLEVKTSLGGIEVPAVLSNNQIRMARQLSATFGSPSDSQQDVYVLVRVYNLERDNPPAPKICFYPDPWRMICQGELLIEGDEGLYVGPPRPR